MASTAITGSPKFRVDVIFQTLKELEQEKDLLESRLAEQKRKRKELEDLVEAAHAKSITARERMIRMKDNVDVAKQKVLRTEEEVQRLERLNTEKRNSISKLNQSISDVNQQEVVETEKLQEELSNLTDKFRSARSYYKEEALQSEISQWKETEVEYEEEADQHTKALEGLNENFIELKIAGEKLKDKLSAKLPYDLASQDLQNAVSAFATIKEEINLDLQQLEEPNNTMEH